MLGYKTSLKKFKIEIISNIFSDPNGIKLEINYSSNHGELTIANNHRRFTAIGSKKEI
jgi:hypothetical protein